MLFNYLKFHSSFENIYYILLLSNYLKLKVKILIFLIIIQNYNIVNIIYITLHNIITRKIADKHLV